MRLAIGAPVAERAWVLPTWFKCLAGQTLQPESFCFVYSESQDDTWRSIFENSPEDAQVIVKETPLRFYSREERGSDPNDPWRAKHLAMLRNQLKVLFMRTRADAYVSCDTDILLHNPRVLEELAASLENGWDVACALTHLHPWGARAWCPNAGFFTDRTRGFDQTWRRADKSDLSETGRSRIDIPMACYAIKRSAMNKCFYTAHAQGEDIGFAQCLQREGCGTIWHTDSEVEHVWGPSFLEQAA